MSTFNTLHPAIQIIGIPKIGVKDRGHFRTRCSGTRRFTCESGDAIQGRLLFTTAHRLISKCFELSTMEIEVLSECDGKYSDWRTHVLVEDILSKPASMPICLSSGQG